MAKVDRDFFARNDVTGIARELLGKKLCTYIQGIYTSGRITEVEAYNGRTDAACHAHLDRRTQRTQIMYGKPGFAYVYLCYGIHHLFNIVTNQEDMADAILIRAVEPMDGIEYMLDRRKLNRIDKKLTCGPGNVSKALGISTEEYGEDLTGNRIWIEYLRDIPASDIVASPRIGVDYAGEDALLPWRFTPRDEYWVSKKPVKNSF